MMIWKVEEVLISWKKEWQFFGRTRNFKEVFFSPYPNSLLKGEGKEDVKIWDIVKVKITELDKYVLKGELI
jgi:tRNA A37 methylthiotransferase MiaB